MPLKQLLRTRAAEQPKIALARSKRSSAKCLVSKHSRSFPRSQLSRHSTLVNHGRKEHGLGHGPLQLLSVISRASIGKKEFSILVSSFSLTPLWFLYSHNSLSSWSSHQQELQRGTSTRREHRHFLLGHHYADCLHDWASVVLLWSSPYPGMDSSLVSFKETRRSDRYSL